MSSQEKESRTGFKIPYFNIELSSGTIIFILTVSTYVLCYLYNYGYNSYYNIPSYFTDYNFSGLLENFFGILTLILGLITFLFVIFTIFSSIIIPVLKRILKKDIHINVTLNYFFFLIIYIIVFKLFTKLLSAIFEVTDLNTYFKMLGIYGIGSLLLIISAIVLSAICSISETILIFLNLRGFLTKKKIDNNSNEEIKEWSIKHPKLKHLVIPIYNLFTNKYLKISNKICPLILAFMLLCYGSYVMGNREAKNQNDYWVLYSQENHTEPLTTCSAIISSNNDNFIITEVDIENREFNENFKIVSKENLNIVHASIGPLKRKK